MSRSSMAFLVLVLVVPLLTAAGGKSAKIDYSNVPGLDDAGVKIPGLLVELKYSTTDNFLKRDVYGDLEKCYLQKDALRMLAKATADLKRMRPDLTLLTYDCARPSSVQRQMWEIVKGTPQQSYVANPNTKTGSIHNYGCAVDLTLATRDGKSLDLGTPFDFFGKLAQPRHEMSMLRSGKLTAEQFANRLLLREVMIRAGFLPIASEWWHFNCAPNYVARKKYKKIP
ncbi:MAG TPA: M15 family metallopeptidase [Myxococcota bacterium]|nr:M15 family metallopeptidase [Myxococcota bacterium]